MTGSGRSGPVGLEDLDATIAPLIQHAGEIALRYFRASPAVRDKGGTKGFDPVTEADRGIEAYLRGELSTRYPSARITGEEGGTTGADGPMQWLIDPIDGTKAFVTGVPLWGVLLGLVFGGRPVAGWCRQPYLDETYAAVNGQGWLEHGGRRRALGTRPTTDLSEASMYSTHPSMFAPGRDRAGFDNLTSRVRLQRFGGDCYSYCLLASGHIDLVVEAGLQAYDIVPLIPIVDAAGGVVTTADGRPPLEGGFVVAAATPALHAQALACLGG